MGENAEKKKMNIIGPLFHDL